ncbi:MAG: chromosomal replication initiator protein DnaA [Bacilli bacterium]|jgi:chromosomal replication initiator protein|nr:chromosomal replication initiator protein DnaA [Bacilli bacterium]MCH4210389.1 chromosomal replication initiator protein DnaA [Bacilli bacterium]MCH4277561.1 chromosomal replication initiator protein DnaA [Bacilli bacterium]MCI2055113.1 chromosomal replication initiator protein DnaA [Bacilli bacterium]
MDSTVSEIASLWDRILLRIKEKINDQIVYDSFFEGSYLYSINGSTMLVVVNTELAVQILSTQYIEMVNSVVMDVTESNYEIRFIQSSDIKKNKEVKQAKPAFFADSYLNKGFTFKNFVVGDSNREAYQAALMVSQHPGKLFNPVLIFGNSGLGKTHLLQAIGNSINDRFPTLKVLYVTAEDFFTEFMKYLQGDKDGNSIVDWFKNNVDVLLIDDVQFLVNKQKTEETFFSIYNSFHAAGKQVVITADQHPKNLNGLDERLKSRFISGLPLSINPPEKETCEAILRMKISANGLDVNDFDPDVISYFAEKFRSNIRELEGALDRLIFYIITIKPTKHVNLETAMASVQSLVDVENDKAKLSETKIINTVADYYNLSSVQLTGKVRTSQIAMARHIAMYLIRDMLDIPFTKIGAIFGGKDHATVMNGVNKVEKNLKEDKELLKAVTELRSRLK